jgi:RND family efflux transporter MFP subunit
MFKILPGIVLIASLAGCKSDPTSPKAATVPVVTATVERGAMDQTLDATGEVLQPVEARLGAEVSGTIENVPGRVGAIVHRGDVLVQFDARPMEIALQSARARLAQSQANLESRRVARERVRLRAAGVLAVAAENQGAVSGTEAEIARLDMRESDAQVASAEADATAAEAAVAGAVLDLKRARVTAPFDGVIRDLSALRGQRVGAGAQLVTVLGRGDVEIIIDLPTFGAVIGQTATVGTPPLTATGIVSGVVPGLSPARTQRVRLVVKAPPDWLLPGAVVPVSLVIGHSADAISIPRDALTAGAAFVVHEGAVTRVPLNVRWEAGDRIVVDGALQQGDAVVVRGNEALTDGAHVAAAAAP